MDKQQILVVDDLEVNRSILDVMFRTNYDILQASNGEEAIEALKNNENIVLILLDIVMPVLDGFGVLDYMKSLLTIKQLLWLKLSRQSLRYHKWYRPILLPASSVRQPVKNCLIRQQGCAIYFLCIIWVIRHLLPEWERIVLQLQAMRMSRLSLWKMDLVNIK